MVSDNAEAVETQSADRPAHLLHFFNKKNVFFCFFSSVGDLNEQKQKILIICFFFFFFFKSLVFV